ncbi:MAG: hypothetical protein RLZZ308_565 [Candidatus Parcubacteria bacterium]
MNTHAIISQALKSVASQVVFTLEIPASRSHGDYATNIAFPLAKVRGVSPIVCAEELVSSLTEELKTVVARVEVASPGFINFFLHDAVVREMNTGRVVTTSLVNNHVLVEHSSPNLFKPFHIGHLMNNIVGEFVARAIAKGGARVEVLCFPSDISFGIAKAVYVWKKDREEGKAVSIEVLEQDASIESFKKVVDYFGQCYVRGVALAKENPELEKEIREIAKNLYSEIESGGVNTLTDDYLLWSRARNINQEYFRQVIEGIGSKMGTTIYESEVSGTGKDIVEKNLPHVFTESEGAIVYIPDEERKDINTSVFINSEGHPTYEAKDIGLIYKKFTEHGAVDRSYFITDNEQTHHFKVVLDAALKLGDAWGSWVEKSTHVPHGRMLFKGQKMSSRLGGVPLALDVIGVVEEEVRERSSDKIAHLNEDEKNTLVRDIALSALRISVLRSKPGININFDPDVSLSFEGDSGPYLMYTHARASSLLDKGASQGIAPMFGDIPSTSLEHLLLHYEDVLEDVIETLSPQKLVAYLFSITQEFNGYYASQQILVEGDTTGNAHRLAIVARARAILKDGLHVLGCNAPERM